jgi:hypothetical protein
MPVVLLCVGVPWDAVLQAWRCAGVWECDGADPTPACAESALANMVLPVPGGP